MKTNFDLQEWLKTINVRDEKYDYVMHNSHWLTCEWSPNCEQCRNTNPITQDLINLNETFDLYKSALADTPNSVDKKLITPMRPKLFGPPSSTPINVTTTKIPFKSGIAIRKVMRN